MKVAILGTGTVGQSMAKGFIGLGHEVIVGTRDPKGASASAALEAIGKGARAATLAEAARDADMAVLATNWSGTENALRLAGPDHLAGKLVIDATNPLDASAGAPRLALGYTSSGGEAVQAWLPKSRVVKAFNIVTATHMVHPKLPDGTPDMFIAGNDAQAKRQVAEILHAFGWSEPIDIGGIEGARLLEALAMLWITYGIQNNHWTHAFKLLGR